MWIINKERSICVNTKQTKTLAVISNGDTYDIFADDISLAKFDTKDEAETALFEIMGAIAGNLITYNL